MPRPAAADAGTPVGVLSLTQTSKKTRIKYEPVPKLQFWSRLIFQSMKNISGYITFFSFLAAAAVISVLLILPKDFFQPQKKALREARYIKPVLQENDFDTLVSEAELSAVKEMERGKVELEDGEIICAALLEDFDKDGSEEQIIAYRNLLKENNPIYITYIDYEEDAKRYKRIWSAPTSATRNGTISLFTKDLTGDRSSCVILTGMNGSGDHTMTVFKVIKRDSNGETTLDKIDDKIAGIKKIADIKIDGTISIIEVERTQAYQLGLTNGASFDIKGRGQDAASSNEFDQVEITYSYNPTLGQYTQSRVTRIPGTQAEATRLSRLLNGNTADFERFIAGLWYRVSPDMSINNSQYIYFDTSGRELIFYDKNTQQVYKWLSSTSTRYGLYVSSQNISVATLRRVMDIELETINSIRVKVFEDVRMKIGLNAPWDGSYRKSSSLKKTDDEAALVNPYIDAAYNSPLGSVEFSSDGHYRLTASGRVQNGRYVFFMLEGSEYLEFAPEEAAAGMRDGQARREVYRVDRRPTAGFSLRRVRLGAKGVQEFHEDPVVFIPPE
jgi:hypothetical protein